jgi:hypothetical protein
VRFVSGHAFSRFALFWTAGTFGSVLAGAMAFGAAAIQPGRPPFQSISVGILVAGVFAAVRASKPAAALALVSGWAALHLGASLESGWPTVLARPGWCLGIGFGACVSAAVFHQLARQGYRFGKFLIAGPMMAGFWIAATPVVMLGGDPHDRLVAEMLMNAFLGLLIGDGAGLGVETAEWILGETPRP